MTPVRCALLAGSFALVTASTWPAGQAAADQKPDRKARMLMLTVSKTFTHNPVKRAGDELAPAEIAVTQIGQESGLFTVNCTQDPQRDFTREALEQTDLVFFYTQGPDLGIPKDALEYFLETWLKQKGHGFVATHSSTDTYGDHKPYWDVIGGTFNGHPWNANETVTITEHDRKHPGSRMWPGEFQIQDEIYQYKNFQPEKVRVLMSLNMARCQTKKPYHVPVAWVKTIGEGRLFYTNLGHNTETWNNKLFRQSLLGGIRWTMGLDEGEATPNPELSAAQDEKAKADATGQ